MNLFVSAFFLFGALSAFAQGALMAALGGGIFSGAVFIQAILSIALQRSLQDPSRGLKESTPGGLRIIGWFSIVYGVLLILPLWFYIASPDLFTDFLKTLPQQGPEHVETNAIVTLFVLVAIHGAMIVVNSRLAFGFLRLWEHRQQNEN